MADSDLVKFLPDVTCIKGNGEKFKYFILCKKPQQQKTQKKKKKFQSVFSTLLNKLKWSYFLSEDCAVEFKKCLSRQERGSRERICHMSGSFQVVQQFLATSSFGLIKEGIWFFLGCSNGNTTLNSEFVIALLFIFRWNKNSHGPLMKERVLKVTDLGRNSKWETLT